MKAKQKIKHQQPEPVGHSAYELAKDFGLPFIILIIGIVVTGLQIKLEDERIKRQVKLEDKRIVQQNKINKERNDITVLNNYQRSISDLFSETSSEKIKNKPNTKFFLFATALTRSTLPQLDGSKKRNLIDFLVSLKLIYKDTKGHAPISLEGADLSKTNLTNIWFRRTILKYANFKESDIAESTLINADLEEANLKFANLKFANLSNSNLSNANLYGADLRFANLSGAKLSYAYLENAKVLNTDSHDLFSPQQLQGIVIYIENAGAYNKIIKQANETYNKSKHSSNKK